MLFTKLIIDANNLFHKCFYVAKKDLKETIIMFLKMNDYYVNKYLNTKIGEVIYCFDNPTSKIETRKLLDSNYKANRVKQSKEFYKTLEFLKLILMNRENNNRIIAVTFAEADDIVKPLLEEIDINRNRILLISEDLDWARGMQKNVYWYAKKIVWSLDLFKEKYGFFPTSDKIIMYKTFRGDSSDCIKAGLPYVQEKDLLKVIADYSNIYTFLAEYDKLEYLSDNIKLKVKLNDNKLRKNYQLVNYIELQKEVLDDYTIHTSFNRIKLKNLYKAFKIDIKEVETNLERFEKFVKNKDLKNNIMFQAKKLSIR